MRKELDDSLCKDFPKLFKDRNASPSVTCMCWGFPGDGWEPLIRRCAEKLEAINNRTENPDEWVIAAQVKEKFGTLRFYIEGGTAEYSEEARAAVREAENESEVTCERCAAPGTIGGKRWISTLCKSCREEQDFRSRSANMESKEYADQDDEDGQTIVEYLLVWAVLIVVCSLLCKKFGVTEHVQAGLKGFLEGFMEASKTIFFNW